MTMQHNTEATEPNMDPGNLYLEETYTDRRVGTLKRLTPVKRDGKMDTARPVLFVGQAQMLTAVGALPLTFEIDARSLEEAVQKFADAARVAVDHTVEELKNLQREAASSIVIPEPGAGGFGGPGGGLPGGGKIKLP
jgi:hypothetical protein